MSLQSPAPEKNLCAICHETQEKSARLDACCHQFCFDCIVSWTNINSSCPMCKQDVAIVTRTDDNKVQFVKKRKPEPDEFDDEGGLLQNLQQLYEGRRESGDDDETSDAYESDSFVVHARRYEETSSSDSDSFDPNSDFSQSRRVRRRLVWRDDADSSESDSEPDVFIDLVSEDEFSFVVEEGEDEESEQRPNEPAQSIYHGDAQIRQTRPWANFLRAAQSHQRPTRLQRVSPGQWSRLVGRNTPGRTSVPN